MAEVASAYVTLLPSLRGFGSDLNRQVSGDVDKAGRTQGKRLGSSMKTGFAGTASKIFVPLAAAPSMSQIVKFFGDSIQGASDLNETTTKTQAIFGKATAEVQAFASKGAAALGRDRAEVFDASATFGTFGKAAGMSGKDLAKFSTGFAGLSTDLASFCNTSPSRPCRRSALRCAVSLDPRIRQYGVLLDDATLRQAALKLGLIKTTKDALTPGRRCWRPRPRSTGRPRTHRATSVAPQAGLPTASASCPPDSPI